MPLINCKIHLELNLNNNCIMYGVDTFADGDNVNNRETTFKITSTKLYVPVVTLSTKYKVNLTKQLNERFKRSVYWNGYKSKIETKTGDNDNVTRFPLDGSFQGANRLFVLAFDNTNNGDNKVERNSHRKYFLPRVNITNYNLLLMAAIFMINQFLIRSKSMMKLEKLQQEKEMITQLDVCYITNISKIITN